MALNLEDKKALVAEVAEVAAKAQSVVAAEYRGLTVGQMTELRAKARKQGVYMRVVKNTLARKALAGTSFETVGPKLKGPLVLAFSKDDPGAAARVVKDFAKAHEKLVATLVSLGGQVLPGAELEKVFTAIEAGKVQPSKPGSFLGLGTPVLPALPLHGGDRNRTSPFAFTGNKFEFRALGSNQSLGLPNTVLNTIVAEAVDYLAEELENELNSGRSLEEALRPIIIGARFIAITGRLQRESDAPCRPPIAVIGPREALAGERDAAFAIGAGLAVRRAAEWSRA